jgi:hypothetical protein
MSYYLDVLGRSFSVPDPVIVTALSGSYRAIATEIGDTRSQLSALASPQAAAEWTGLAADTFGGKIGALPGQLGKAWQSYSTVAWALSDYANQLDPVVAALRRLAYEADDAEGALRGTMIARDQVIQQGQDPQATGWNTRLQEATANVGAIEQRLCTLLAELDALSAECVTRIGQAQAEGIQNNLITDFQRYVVQDTLVPYAELQYAEGRIVLTVVYDILVKPFVDLSEDTAKFLAHPSFHTLGVALGDLATVLAIVVMVVGLAVPGLDVAAFPLLLGLSAAATASDTVAVATHEKDATWTQVGKDGFGLACIGVGRVLDAGVTRDGNLLTNASGHQYWAQWDDLATGDDARASGGALWSAGVKRAFSWEDMRSAWGQDVSLTNPLDTLTTNTGSWLRLGGEDRTYSPAAVVFQHIKFGLDRAGDALTVYDAQHLEGQLQ